MIAVPTPTEWVARAQGAFLSTGKHANVGGYCCPERAFTRQCSHEEGVEAYEMLIAHGLTDVQWFFVREVDVADLDVEEMQV